MKSKWCAFAACIMLVTLSCNENEKDGKGVAVQEMSLEVITADTSFEPPPPGLNTGDQVHTGDNDGIRKETWDKKIIKNGTLQVEVKNYRDFNNSIHQLVARWGAYIASEEENTSDYKIENKLTIKIPVQYFDEAVHHLSTQEGKLLQKNITAKDVTNEYFDTRARIEAKKRIRDRYLEMVRKAKTMEEVLQVEREINAIQEQVEAGQFRAEFLNHASAYSTLQLTFFQVLNPKAVDPGQPSFSTRLLLALSQGAQWIGDLLIFAVTLWPLWLALIFAIWMVRVFVAAKVKSH